MKNIIPTHMIIKLLKTSDKGKNLKRKITYIEMKVRVEVDFLLRTRQAKSPKVRIRE